MNTNYRIPYFTFTDNGSDGSDHRRSDHRHGIRYVYGSDQQCSITTLLTNMNWV